MTKDWDIIITNRSKLLSVDLHEVWRYRDLLSMYVKRDIVTFYKQTILGPAWAIVQPLLTTVVFTIVFGNLAHLTTADVEGDFILPGFLFYMSGNICWAYFSSLHPVWISISMQRFFLFLCSSLCSVVWGLALV